MSLENIAKHDASRWLELADQARAQVETRLFIDGDWTDAAEGGRFETIDPSNGEVVAAMAVVTEKDVDLSLIHI